MNEFIIRVGELDTCYVTTGMVNDIKFDIDTVDITETELVIGNLDDAEIRIPLSSRMENIGDDTWVGEGISIRF